MLEALRSCMTKNTTLTKYELKHNQMDEEGVEELCKILADAKHV